MRRVVIDNNVLVRAFLKKGGSDDKVFRMFLGEKIELYYSLEMIDEFLKVMYYPRIKKRLKFDQRDVELFVGSITTRGKLVTPRAVNICRDVKDNVILGTALASGGKKNGFLVTADEDLLVLKGKIGGVEIVTAREFTDLADML